MQKTIIHSALFVAILILGFSCTEYIDVEPAEFANNILIDAAVTNEYKNHVVRLSGTKHIDDPDFPIFSEAQIVLEFNDTSIYFFEADDQAGVYYSDIAFAGLPNTNYSITISNIDGNNDGILDVYTASARMGSALELDSIGYYYYDRWEAVAVTCYAWDPPETNYYNFRSMVNGVLNTDTIYEFNASDDLFFNGSYTNGVSCLFLQDEYPDEFVDKGDTITLIIENIDEAYYNYILTSINEYYGYNPMFGGMPANVSGNFSNNALGIFRVYTLTSSSVIVTDEINRR